MSRSRSAQLWKAMQVTQVDVEPLAVVATENAVENAATEYLVMEATAAGEKVQQRALSLGWPPADPRW